MDAGVRAMHGAIAEKSQRNPLRENQKIEIFSCRSGLLYPLGMPALQSIEIEYFEGLSIRNS
jgi:hypothetical protein